MNKMSILSTKERYWEVWETYAAQESKMKEKILTLWKT